MKGLTLKTIGFAMIFVAALTTLTVTGCETKSMDKEAERAVTMFFDYLHDGDSGSAQTLCTDRALSQEKNGENVFNMLSEEYSSGDNKYEADRLVSDIRGRTAEVWSRDDESFRITLIADGSKWKIDEFDWTGSSTSNSRNNDDEDDDPPTQTDNDDEDADDNTAQTDNPLDRRRGT